VSKTLASNVGAGLMAAVLLLSACTSDDNVSAPPSTTGPPAAAAPTTAAPTTAAPTTTVPTTEAPTTEAPTTEVPATPRPVATTLVPPPGPLFGIAVPEGRIETVVDIEGDVGQTFHLVRVFVRWEVDLADTDVAQLQADGRAIHLPNGVALDYRGAWRRMVELVRLRGGEDIEMVWTVGSSVLRQPEGRAFYPGDDVVDVIGADLYNWFTCQGTDRPWVSFDDLLEPAVAFAAERGKPLALPEFASAADPADPGRRAGWMDAAADVMAEWDPQERMGVELDYVAWFDVTAPGGTYPNCRWSHRTDVETERAFDRMARDLIGG